MYSRMSPLISLIAFCSIYPFLLLYFTLDLISASQCVFIVRFLFDSLALLSITPIADYAPVFPSVLFIFYLGQTSQLKSE